MNNKTNLALAISALIFSGTASAVVDLNSTPAGTAGNTYASENILPANLVNLGSILSVSNGLGSGVSAGQTRELHYDIGNATWSAAITPANLVKLTGPAFFNVIISGGGGIGQNFVTFQVTGAVPAGNAGAERVQFNLPDVVASNQNDITVTYRQYELASEAATGHPTGTHLGAPKLLATATASIAEFGPALGLSCSEHAYVGVGQNDIDVAQASNYFDANTNDETTIVGGFSAPFNRGYLATDGTPIVDADEIVASAVLTLSGSNGWSAVDNVANIFAVPGARGFNKVGVNFVATGVQLANYEPAVFPGSPLLGNALFQASVPPINTTAILPSVITLTSVATPQLGFTASTASGSCILGSMARNGSHDALPFVLTPNGFYTNYVRISNRSSTGGAVYLTLIDDSGQRADFPISDVAGAILPASGTAGSLNAGSSTTLININEIMTAALVANPLLMTNEKFRLEVDAEFGDTGFAAGVGPSLSVTGKDFVSGVNVQSFSMSKDGNSFFMLNKN